MPIVQAGGDHCCALAGKRLREGVGSDNDRQDRGQQASMKGGWRGRRCVQLRGRPVNALDMVDVQAWQCPQLLTILKIFHADHALQRGLPIGLGLAPMTPKRARAGPFFKVRRDRRKGFLPPPPVLWVCHKLPGHQVPQGGRGHPRYRHFLV